MESGGNYRINLVKNIYIWPSYRPKQPSKYQLFHIWAYVFWPALSHFPFKRAKIFMETKETINYQLVVRNDVFDAFFPKKSYFWRENGRGRQRVWDLNNRSKSWPNEWDKQILSSFLTKFGQNDQLFAQNGPGRHFRAKYSGVNHNRYMLGYVLVKFRFVSCALRSSELSLETKIIQERGVHVLFTISSGYHTR